MARKLAVEIKGRDEFWSRAFAVEWQHRFPDRELKRDAAGFVLIDEAWRADLEAVAAEVFCTVVVAPPNPRRRAWINALLPK